MATSPELELTSQIAEFLRNRVFGKYRGLVEDIDDPENLGRIRARVPAVFGEEPSPWAMPCLPFAGAQHGLSLIPEAGDGVWIEFEGGDLSRPIWSGCWWARDQRPSPDGAGQRLLATTAGHRILIDEDADEIRLEHPGGAKLSLTSSGIVLTLGTSEVEIGTSEIKINQGIAKFTTAGASLVNDAFKVGG